MKEEQWTVIIYARDFLSLWTTTPSKKRIFPMEIGLFFREHVVTIHPGANDLKAYTDWKIGQKVQCGDIQGTVSCKNSTFDSNTLRIILNCELIHHEVDSPFLSEKPQVISLETLMGALNEAFPEKTPDKFKNSAFKKSEYSGVFTIEYELEVPLDNIQVPKHLEIRRKKKA